jgi:hypothetical protein
MSSKLQDLLNKIEEMTNESIPPTYRLRNIQKLILENREYEAYGDVSPIEHGGRWVKKLKPQEFMVVVLDQVEDVAEGDNNLRLGICYVDLTDEWIDKQAVEDYCDVETSNEQIALNVVSYYGAENCGGSYSYMKEEEAIETLATYGITV